MAMRRIIMVVTGCLILWTGNKVQGMPPPAMNFPNLFSAPYPAVSSPNLFFNQDMQLPPMGSYPTWGPHNYEHNSFHTSPFNLPLQWMNQPSYNRFQMPPLFSPLGHNVFPPMSLLPFPVFEPQTYFESTPRMYHKIPAAASKNIKLNASMDKSTKNQQKIGTTTPTDNQPQLNTEIPANEHPPTTATTPMNNPQTTILPTKEQAQTTHANEQPQTTAAAPVSNPQTTVLPINNEAQTTPANEQPQTTAAAPVSNPQTTVSHTSDEAHTTPVNEQPQTTAAAPLYNPQTTVDHTSDEAQPTPINGQPQTTAAALLDNPQTTISPTNDQSQTTPANEQPQTTAAALKNSLQTTVSPTNDQAQTTVAALTSHQPESTPEIFTNDQPQSTAVASVSDEPQESQTDNAIIVSDKSEVTPTMSPSTEYPQQEAVSSADAGPTEILASASPSPPQGDDSSDSTTTKSSISIFIPSKDGQNKVRAVLIGPGSFSGSSGSSGSSISGNGNIAILDPETLQRDISSTFTGLKPPQISPIMFPSQAGIPSFPNLSGGSSASNGAGNMGFPHFLPPGVQFQQNDGRIPEDSQPSIAIPGIMKDNFLNSNFQNPYF